MNEKKTAVGRSEPVRRYDRPGHLHPAHAARLLALSRSGREHADDGEFLRASAEEDDLASELGETTLVSMTSGDAAFTSDVEAPVPEEIGGPFVVTSTIDEFTEAFEELSPLDAPRGPELSKRSVSKPIEQAEGPESPESSGTIYLPGIQRLASWFANWGGKVSSWTRVRRG